MDLEMQKENKTLKQLVNNIKRKNNQIEISKIQILMKKKMMIDFCYNRMIEVIKYRKIKIMKILKTDKRILWRVRIN